MEQKRKKKTSKNPIYRNVLICSIVIVLISVIASILLGSADLSPSEIWRVLRLKIFSVSDDELKKTTISIIWDLRFPRAILAIVAGGGLAIVGAALQATTQNIMAEPYILGVSNGASAMVAVAYFIGGNYMFPQYGVSLFAMVGAVGALLLVYLIGAVGNSASSNRLVLAGLTVSVVLNAFTYFFMAVSPNPNMSRNIMSWMMGSLAGARWTNLLIPVIGSVLGLCFYILFARAFNLISLGDETAISLGVDIQKIRRATIIVSALVTGCIVSVSGVIGFVGFVIPHIMRLIIGYDHRKLFPLCYTVGGIFLLWMDILARTILSPKELPIGIFTAMFAGPFFVWLIYKKNRS